MSEENTEHAQDAEASDVVEQRAEALEDSSTPIDEAQEPENTEVITPENDATTAEEPAKPKGETVPKSRFNEVYYKRKEAERKLEEAERRIELFQAQQQTQATPSAPSSGQTQINASNRPTLEQFDYDDGKYQEALVEWKVEQKLNQYETQRNQRKQQEELKGKQQNFNKRMAAYAANNPQYEAALKFANPNGWNQVIDEVILESDVGPQLDHYLLENPEVADDLMGKTPRQAATALGRIEATLSNTSERAEQPTKQITKAPLPISTATGSGGNSSNAKLASAGSMEDYYNIHQANMKARRGA